MKRLAVLAIAGASMLTVGCNGHRVWTHPADSKPDLLERDAGSCVGMGSLLLFEGNEYLGAIDPDVPPRRIPGEIPFLSDTSLPADARDSGYRQGARELWTSDTVGIAAVFIVDPTHVERWPRWARACD